MDGNDLPLLIEPGAGSSPGSDDIGAVRSALLEAYPNTVEELVQGETIAGLLTSLALARAAYERIAAKQTLSAAAASPDAATRLAPVSPAPPAGGGTRLVVDPDRLPTVEKIRRGLAAR